MNWSKRYFIIICMLCSLPAFAAITISDSQSPNPYKIAGAIALITVLGYIVYSAKNQENAEPYYFHPGNAEKNTTTLVAHGLVADQSQAYQYVNSVNIDGETITNDRYLYSTPFATIRFKDAGTGLLKYIRAHKSSLGQRAEINRMHNAYNAYFKNLDSFMVHGISRGGSVAINFVAQDNPENLSGMVLESPFDSLKGLTRNLLGTPMMHHYVYRIAASLFSNFRRDGAHPIAQIKYIKNKSLPILIVCSETDLIVPWQSSARLYKKFLEEGFTNVYLLITRHGPHAKILWSEDGLNYQNAVHAFKRSFGIKGYNPAFADEGDLILQTCKIPLNQINERLQK